MPSVSIPAAAASVSALGSIEQGQAESNAANYNAQVARNNANYSTAAGQAQATEEGLKSAAVGGKIKASQAANNIDVNSGSAVKVQEGAREAGEVNAVDTENNALLQAYGYNAQASLDKTEASQAEEAGDLNAVGGLLGSASSTNSGLGQWLQSSASGGSGGSGGGMADMGGSGLESF